jgi:hypothetical protein
MLFVFFFIYVVFHMTFINWYESHLHGMCNIFILIHIISLLQNVTVYQYVMYIYIYTWEICDHCTLVNLALNVFIASK